MTIIRVKGPYTIVINLAGEATVFYQGSYTFYVHRFSSVIIIHFCHFYFTCVSLLFSLPQVYLSNIFDRRDINEVFAVLEILIFLINGGLLTNDFRWNHRSLHHAQDIFPFYMLYYARKGRHMHFKCHIIYMWIFTMVSYFLRWTLLKLFSSFPDEQSQQKVWHLGRITCAVINTSNEVKCPLLWEFWIYNFSQEL